MLTHLLAGTVNAVAFAVVWPRPEAYANFVVAVFFGAMALFSAAQRRWWFPWG